MKNTTITLTLLAILLISCVHSKKPGHTVEVQHLPGFELDGSGKEWKHVPERILYADPYGNYPEKQDLSASFKIAWKENKLLLFFQIKDDAFVSDTSMPWRGDAVEIFLSDYRGSDNIIQYSVVTGNDGQENVISVINDYRKLTNEPGRKPSINGHINKVSEEVYLELSLDLDGLNLSGKTREFALQVYVDDSDKRNDKNKNQLTWHPLGHSYINSFAAFKIKLNERNNRVLNGTSRVVVTDNKTTELYLFGTEEGDRINVRSNKLSLDFISTSADPYLPEVFKLDKLDPENDSIEIFINDEFLNEHILFLASREYQDLEPHRFDREIRLFRMKDMLNMPDEGGVLFIGSSSIRMWNTLKKDFPELNIIHRGFGGSTSADALNYMDYIVLPYNPSVIVYYEGDNDIPKGMSYDEIILNMKKFIERARKYNDEVVIYMISPKPSVGRLHLWDKYLRLHKRMKELVKNYDSVFFVNVAAGMFEGGELREDIFIEDGVHMNEEGYDIWKNTLREEMDLNVME